MAREHGRLSPATRRAAYAILVAKLLTLLLLGWAAVDYPAHFNYRGYIANYRGNHGEVPASAPGADIVLRTWDAEHYLSLAEHGYGGRGPENAYYPLYPALVRLFAPLLLGDSLATAVMLSTLFGIAALLVLHDLLVQRFSVAEAHVTVGLLCVQPAAFFFQLPYTESLFLLLLAWFFSALHKSRFVLAGVAGALLALTRPIGVLSMAPLALVLLQGHWQTKGKLNARDLLAPWLWRAAAICMLPLIGWAAYFGVMFVMTGDPWHGVAIQKSFITAPAFSRLLDPLGFVRTLIDVRSPHAPVGSLLDRIAFLGVAVAGVALWRRPKDRDLFVLTLVCGLVPAMATALMSFTRYAAVLFPVFLVLAGQLAPKPRRGVLAVVFIALLAVQLWLLYRHTNHRWAA